MRPVPQARVSSAARLGGRSLRHRFDLAAIEPRRRRIAGYGSGGDTRQVFNRSLPQSGIAHRDACFCAGQRLRERQSAAALGTGVRRSQTGGRKEASILTAQQIASLDLTGVDWAVLSACNTGNGDLQDGEGVLSLQRAFRVAGAHSVIMALWPVDDNVTRRFMHCTCSTPKGSAGMHPRQMPCGTHRASCCWSGARPERARIPGTGLDWSGQAIGSNCGIRQLTPRLVPSARAGPPSAPSSCASKLYNWAVLSWAVLSLPASCGVRAGNAQWRQSCPSPNSRGRTSGAGGCVRC